jgi:hypothetical protein
MWMLMTPDVWIWRAWCWSRFAVINDSINLKKRCKSVMNVHVNRRSKQSSRNEHHCRYRVHEYPQEIHMQTAPALRNVLRMGLHPRKQYISCLNKIYYLRQKVGEWIKIRKVRSILNHGIYVFLAGFACLWQEKNIEQAWGDIVDCQ